MARPVFPVLSIIRWEARGLPSRALIMHCEVRNPNPGTLFIADSWLEVRLDGGHGGPILADGRLFHPLYNMVDPAVLKGRESDKGQGEITIPLNPSAIQSIENHRRGGDLVLQIDSRVLLCPVYEGPSSMKSVLSAPIKSRFSLDGNDGRIQCKIPQSEWIKLLPRLDWSEIELFELPREFLRSHPRLARARERLKDAETSLARGNWEGVLQDCRKAFEAAAIAVTGEEEHQVALPKLRSLLGEGAKGESLNALALAFGKFFHLGRHEQPEVVTFDRPDAVLTLRITASLLDYLAHV